MIRLFLGSVRFRWFEFMAGAIVVAIVVAALVVQNSLSASAEGQIHDLSHNLGKNMLVVPEETDMFDFYTQRYDDATMPDDYPDRIRSSTLARHIRGIQPILFGNLEVNGVPLVIVGQKALFRASGSERETVRKAVLGDEAASRLGLKQDDTPVVGDVPLVVVQVAGSMREGFDMAVVTELSVAQQLLDRPGAINAMRVGGCWCSTDVPALASDVNKDGISLSVADLVYLIRVVVGDAQPYPKEVVTEKINYTHDAGVVKVLGGTEIGGAYLVVAGDAAPTLLATNMEMAYEFDGQNTRIIVTPKLEDASGLTGEFLAGVGGDILSIEIATVNGLPLVASSVPTRYSLSQNYPNPFNSTTVIGFSLREVADVKLKIYNVLGQEVITLLNGYFAVGSHTVEWNGTDTHGQLVASGVYFYHLEVEDFAEIKKMMLLK